MRALAPHLLGARRLGVYLRFARYLAWEFRWPLGVFAAIVLAGGYLLHRGFDYEQAGRLGYVEACYDVFLLVFMEANLPFPEQWHLQLLMFAVPIVGLGAIADSVVRLGFLMFSRKQDLPEWQRMVASLYRNHVVVVGVGRVGVRIIRGLLELHEPVVAVEVQAKSPLLDELHEQGLPVIHGDGRQRAVLLQAGVDKARAVILATSDDLVNLDAGLTARDLNAQARVVLRLFDDTLASKISGAFSLPVISTARVSAPAFIAAATGRQVYHEFKLAGQTVHLVDLKVASGGGLVGRRVGDIQADRQVNIVMHNGPDGVNINPAHDVPLAAGDMILVIAPIERLLELEAANRPAAVAKPP